MGMFYPPERPEPSFGTLRDFVDASIGYRVSGLSVTFRESVLTIVGCSSAPKKMARKVQEAARHWFVLNQRTLETVQIEICRPNDQ
ncbi:MAG: hypothetical protein Q7S29_03950 [Candidatus Peribacter sp.]|nr:hypothetical protein [Candidatus Peribacter sp.]